MKIIAWKIARDTRSRDGGGHLFVLTDARSRLIVSRNASRRGRLERGSRSALLVELYVYTRCSGVEVVELCER